MYGACATRGPPGEFVCPLAALSGWGLALAAPSSSRPHAPFWDGDTAGAGQLPASLLTPMAGAAGWL